MSKSRLLRAANTVARATDLGASSSGYLGWRLVPAAPSVAAKLRLVARYAALAALVVVRFSRAKSSPRLRVGGAYRDRTDDLKLAKLALSQLSYGPIGSSL